jgi:putative FmdB family regulatory protein
MYAFRCRDCDTTFDVRATFAEKEAGLEPECPACGSRDVKQIMTAGLLIQTGTGQPARSGCAPTAGPGCCPW